jgi:hypothetical protein
MALPSAVVQKLQGLLGDDVAGKPIFKELLLRNSRDVTDIYRLKLALGKGGIFFTDADMMKRFDLLQRAGAGKLVIRAQPLHSTFEWKYSMKDVAHAVLGTKLPSQETTEALRFRDIDAVSEPQKPARGAPSKMGYNSVVLPIGETVVTVNGLPANFDTKLVQAISAALMAVARQNESA